MTIWHWWRSIHPSSKVGVSPDPRAECGIFRTNDVYSTRPGNSRCRRRAVLSINKMELWGSTRSSQHSHTYKLHYTVILTCPSLVLVSSPASILHDSDTLSEMMTWAGRLCLELSSAGTHEKEFFLVLSSVHNGPWCTIPALKPVRSSETKGLYLYSSIYPLC